ncbi:MAG: 2-C-methyl-D-erythritol 4-phosphate cytidylyltransferase [Christensenellales bacterium]|nr:2-C-methyl-D-erythritol 4-phosphate cytidylyltransferase [Christensenellales bacterium]
MSVWCVVVAAGRGARAGLGKNKVYFSWKGRTVLGRCLKALSDTGALDGIVLVISPEDESDYRQLCQKEGLPKLVKSVVHGGDCRRRSVRNGLMAVPEDAEIVAIHDAARPFVSAEVVRATIEAAREDGSGVISTPVTDTVKQIHADGSISTPDRASLRAVQTPQTFRFRPLLEAHQRAEQEGVEVTDDAALFEYYYGSVRLVTAPSAEANMKLTTGTDFVKLAEPAIRVGSGYDAHRLKEGRKLILCGVEVPHARGLDGHSDADVATHALMDALLGALGEGDIGRHFPDSDERYRGISSITLLEHVMTLVGEAGYCVANADVTIVAQKPKLAAYIPEMREILARQLGTDAVNVKATTTERMGFEGEELGISSQAVVLLSRV